MGKMNKQEIVYLKEILETLKRIENRLNRGTQLADGGPIRVKSFKSIKHV